MLLQVRQQRTPARPTLPTQKIRRSTTSKKSLKAVVESEIGKQRICTLEDFEYLFEKTAERQGSSCLTQLRQVRDPRCIALSFRSAYRPSH